MESANIDHNYRVIANGVIVTLCVERVCLQSRWVMRPRIHASNTCVPTYLLLAGDGDVAACDCLGRYMSSVSKCSYTYCSYFKCPTLHIDRAGSWRWRLSLPWQRFPTVCSNVGQLVSWRNVFSLPTCFFWRSVCTRVRLVLCTFLSRVKKQFGSTLALPVDLSVSSWRITRLSRLLFFAKQNANWADCAIGWVNGCPDPLRCLVAVYILDELMGWNYN